MMKRAILFGSVALTLASCAGPGKADVASERYVHKYGHEVAMDDWSKRGEDGKVITTLKSGVRVTKSYQRGALEGDTTYTFPHSDIVERVETYKNGELVKEVVHHENGWPREGISYLPGGRFEQTLWYEDGAPQSLELYEDENLLTGEYYAPNHQIESRVTAGSGIRVLRDPYGTRLLHEKIDGGSVVAKLTYHPNGVLEAETPLKEGLVDGVRQTYHPSGEPNSTEIWTRGKQEGLTIVYKNGEVHREVPYANGVRSGVEKVYKSSGDVAEEVTWMNGKKHGPHRTFVEGKVSTKWYYQDQVMPKNRAP